MRCVACQRWSWSHLCLACQERYLTPSLYQRQVEGVAVRSFFAYSDIEPLLQHKHTLLGYHLYRIMARRALAPLVRAWSYPEPVAVIGIDDHVRHGYSHSAILTHALRAPSLIPHYGILRARSTYTYAGKSLYERLSHPRDFAYAPLAQEKVILIDDIITTGTTIREAITTLRAHAHEPILALTLADARY